MAKKILVVDLLCPRGHVIFDLGIIDALSRDFAVHVAVGNGYLGQERVNGASVVYQAPSWLFSHSSKVGVRVKQICVALYWATRLDLDSYDGILVLSYETISFSWVTGLFGRRVPLYAFDHYNLDDFAARVKQWSFRKLSRRVHHLVLEPYMVDVVHRFGGPTAHVSVVPHPMRDVPPAMIRGIKGDKSDIRLRCVAPSGSNDESFVEWMIQEEVASEVLQQHSVSLVLHSSKVSFDDGWLRVYRYQLKEDEYESLIYGADLVVLPYPQTFENRVSGVLLEALACGKYWIGTGVPMFRSYASRYPMLGQVCESYQELLAGILQVTRERLRATPESAWDSVNAAHNRIAVAAALVQAFEL